MLRLSFVHSNLWHKLAPDQLSRLYYQQPVDSEFTRPEPPGYTMSGGSVRGRSITVVIQRPSVPLLRWTISELWWLEVTQVRGEIIRTVLLYCVLKLCTVISTLRWAVFTVLWNVFYHTGAISLCVDLLFIRVYFVCFCFILHSCCITASTVGWAWWDWSLILRTLSSFNALTLLVGSFDP